jgi:hypothetical protein
MSMRSMGVPSNCVNCYHFSSLTWGTRSLVGQRYKGSAEHQASIETQSNKLPVCLQSHTWLFSFRGFQGLYQLIVFSRVVRYDYDTNIVLVLSIMAPRKFSVDKIVKQEIVLAMT